MRFVDQALEIAVNIDPGDLPALTTAGLADRFSAAHRRIYFHGGEAGRAVEIVGLRFGVLRPLEALPEFRERPTQMLHTASVSVQISSETCLATLVDAATLTINEVIIGPALLEGYSSSTWVPPGWSATLDSHGNILMQRIPA